MISWIQALRPSALESERLRRLELKLQHKTGQNDNTLCNSYTAAAAHCNSWPGDEMVEDLGVVLFREALKQLVVREQRPEVRIFGREVEAELFQRPALRQLPLKVQWAELPEILRHELGRFQKPELLLQIHIAGRGMVHRVREDGVCQKHPGVGHQGRVDPPAEEPRHPLRKLRLRRLRSLSDEVQDVVQMQLLEGHRLFLRQQPCQDLLALQPLHQGTQQSAEATQGRAPPPPRPRLPTATEDQDTAVGLLQAPVPKSRLLQEAHVRPRLPRRKRRRPYRPFRRFLFLVFLFLFALLQPIICKAAPQSARPTRKDLDVLRPQGRAKASSAKGRAGQWLVL